MFLKVRNVLSKLDALELEWNELLKTVDPEVKTNETLCVAEGDTIATPVKLESARYCKVWRVQGFI